MWLFWSKFVLVNGGLYLNIMCRDKIGLLLIKRIKLNIRISVRFY